MKNLLAMMVGVFFVCPLFGTLSDGLIAYYKFDGNANDSSGNEHHLTNVGAAKLVTGRKGDANGAYEFNGTSTSKLSADPAVVVQNNFSYSLWFQTSVAMSAHGGSGTAWNPGNDIIHSGFADYEYVGSGLRVGTDGLAIVEHGGMYRSTVFQYTKDIGINWHHVAVVVASGRGEVVYLDGEYVGEAEINDSTLTSFHGNGARAIHLEADGVGGGQWGYYTGCIDDLRIYNRTLSSAEVKALYDGDSAPEVTKCAVTGVTARQRYPWNGLVDITVTLQGSVENAAKADCLFAATNSATKAAIPIEHITRNGDDAGSGNVWTRKFIWDAKADIGAVKIDDVALIVDVEIDYGGVQLWENGPYWAECNVGASQPEECGYYFWWGDTVGYERNANNDGWISVKDSTSYSFSDCPTYGKNNSQLKSAGCIDATGNLVAKYDAATAHLGAPWRMPTDAEFSALINNCDMEWTSRNGVSGRLVKGRGAYASKSIFLPAAGYGYDSYLRYLGSYGHYWSSTPNSAGSVCAWDLYFDSGYFDRSSNYRDVGQSVRSVRGFASSSVTVGGVTTHLSLDCSVGTVSVTGVTARQRYPWNGLVDVVVTLQGSVENVAKADCLFAATNCATKAAIPVEHVTRNGDDTGSGNVWTRKFIWDAKADVGAVRIDDVALTVDLKPLGGVQLWENGPYWAECNVGASQPEECGYYFWWGDTVGYERNANNDGWISVEDGTGFSFSEGNCPTCGKNGSQLQSDGYIDATGNLMAKYDAATAHLGAPWRMPTDAEFSALINNCDTEWTSRNGVSGRLVKGRGAYSSKSIFLPAAGYGLGSDLYSLGSDGLYWSSTPSSGNSDRAWSLNFHSGYFGRYYYYRYDGQSVRSVRGFASSSVTVGGGTTHFALEPPICVSFNANGGSCSMSSEQYSCGSTLGILPTATRDGYEFLGWFTAAVGGTQVTAATVVTADVTFYAQWTPIEYDISYLYLKGSENPNPATYTIEDELTFTALSDVLGWTFAEWSLDGISLGSTGDKTVSAHWTPVIYGITYAGVKGGVNPNPATYTIEDAITFAALSDVTGYRFTGWSPCGIEAGTTGDKTITAQYVPIRYAIAYVNTMGAANPNPTSYTIEDEVTFAAIPDVEGWRFVGWSFAGISRGNTGDVTVSANWEAVTPSVIPDEEEPMDAGVANTYDGIIMDADGLPVGYISIKAGKASGKGAVGTSKVTATIQMVGEAKKVTVKGNVNVSEATFVQSAPDGRVLDLMFTRNSIFGTFDGYEIEGVRNILASTAKGDKGSEAKQRAEAIYGRLKGNYVMAYGDENGWNGLSVSVAAKGKVKVSGKLADGTSVATSTQLIVGEDYSCIPVIYTKKDVSLAFSIYFSNNGGELSVFGYYDAVISRVTALGGERAFCLDGDPYGIFEEAGYELVEEFLPWEVPVAPKGTKWIVADGAKAGQIKMDKDGEVYDKKESDNPSGLKLTFTAKTGLFKGSFKVYAIDAKGKLKSFSATVNGIVVDGIGYGTVTIKKIGSVPVAIE